MMSEDSPEWAIRSVRMLLIKNGLDEDSVDALLNRLRAEIARETPDDDRVRQALYEKIVRSLVEQLGALATSDEKRSRTKTIVDIVKGVIIGAAGSALWDALKITPDVAKAIRETGTSFKPSMASPPASDSFESRWPASDTKAGSAFISPARTSDPTREQRDVFYAVLEYCLKIDAVEPKDILTGAKITNEDYQKFRRRNGDRHYQTISAFIETRTLARLKQRGNIPTYMRPLISFCFPDFFADEAATIASPNDVFLRYAHRDPRHRKDISDTYSGIFDVYRYSSHLDKRPADLHVEEPKDGEGVKEDPWMIRSALEIFAAAEHDEFVRFKLHYHPYENRDGPISIIGGIIIGIKELLYFVGLEPTRYPLIIMSVPHHVRKIQLFTGMILRYHEFGRTIASRVGFRRASSEVKSIDDLHDKIGMKTESTLVEEISVFDRRLVNSIEYGGKSSLLGTLP
jgi:hypothetical protein